MTARSWADEAQSIGIWGQIILLPILAVVFLRNRAVDSDDDRRDDSRDVHDDVSPARVAGH
jgi:hypothetical protein